MMSKSFSLGRFFASALSISPMPGILIIFFISGRSVTVVDPAVWSGALLNALYAVSVTPLKKNKPPSVTIKEAIPLFTISQPWNQPKANVKHNVIKIAVKGDGSFILKRVILSKWKPPWKDI